MFMLVHYWMDIGNKEYIEMMIEHEAQCRCFDYSMYDEHSSSLEFWRIFPC